MINKPPQINNNYGFLNPFADMSASPYNLPLSSKNKSTIIAKLPRKKVVYSEKDKEAQEINKMYMNYDPGEYQKSDNFENQNNYYNIYNRPNIQVNKNNIEEIMKKLLEGYQYPGSNEVKINEVPVLFKSTDFYKLRLHIRSILIPKIIAQLNKNNAEEAYNNCKMLMYYLSIMNPK